MIIDGRKIAEDILAETATRIALLEQPPRLAVIACAPNAATKQYLNIKRRKAEQVGASIEVIEVSESADTDAVITALNKATRENDGVIVQLPLPAHIDTDAVLAALPSGADVDRIGNEAEAHFYEMHDHALLPPVVGAIAEILSRHEVSLSDKHIVVLGEGRLVGRPTAAWCTAQGAHVTVLNKDSKDMGVHTREADIVVLGAGSAHILTPDMVRQGVVVLDAGTSEAGGELRGDADPAIAEKASLFTPVPGGIGPITIAILLRNLYLLAQKRREA